MLTVAIAGDDDTHCDHDLPSRRGADRSMEAQDLFTQVLKKDTAFDPKKYGF
jgi:hypothetical protein